MKKIAVKLYNTIHRLIRNYAGTYWEQMDYSYTLTPVTKNMKLCQCKIFVPDCYITFILL